MARIQQIDKVYVDVRRPASSLETLQQAVGRKSGQGQGGLPITILRSNGEAYENRGRILFSGINVDAGTGDVLLRIEVDNPGRQLLPGMFVRASPWHTMPMRCPFLSNRSSVLAAKHKSGPLIAKTPHT
jgi:multidrug efflux system membrane fusion protein